MFSPQERTPYFHELRQRISTLGGQFNAHLHLDRAGTFHERYFQTADFELGKSNHISLQKKHALIARIHEGPAYDANDLEQRVRSVLETMITLGTRRADTMVDVTPDRVQLDALQLLNRLGKEYQDQITLRTASYTPLGFNDQSPENWEIFREGVHHADFIGALPEADDHIDYPNNIGFTESCRRILELASEENKMVHIHTDQRNDPKETGTERVISAIKEFGAPSASGGEPLLWMVHMISPSTYDEARFEKLTQDLLELNLGVICCPSAAIGMRQLRSLATPTYNSIPRVLELLAAGVPVRIASDNIADLCSPSTTADLVDELFILSAAIRFYDIDILAHLAAGIPLTEEHQKIIREHLSDNESEIDKAIAKYHA